MGKRDFDGKEVLVVVEAFQEFLENGNRDLISKFSFYELNAVSQMASVYKNEPWYTALLDRLEEIKESKKRFYKYSFQVLKFVLKRIVIPLVPILILIMFFGGKINLNKAVRKIFNRQGIVSF